MPAYIIAPALIVALTYWVAWRIDRAEQLIDEQSDGDWPHLPAEMVGGDRAGEGAAGGGCAKASPVGSRRHLRPSSHSGQGAL